MTEWGPPLLLACPVISWSDSGPAAHLPAMHPSEGDATGLIGLAPDGIDVDESPRIMDLWYGIDGLVIIESALAIVICDARHKRLVAYPLAAHHGQDWPRSWQHIDRSQTSAPIIGEPWSWSTNGDVADDPWSPTRATYSIGTVTAVRVVDLDA